VCEIKLKMIKLIVMNHRTYNNMSKRLDISNSAIDNLKDVLKLILHKRQIKVNLYISELLSDHFKYILC